MKEKRRDLPKPVTLEQFYQHDMAISLRLIASILQGAGAGQPSAPPETELRERLTEIKGVGPATAEEIIKAIRE